MKKISKILMVLAVFTFVSTSLFAGGAKETTKPELPFNLTKAEKDAGWRYFMPIGFKLHRPAYFDTYKDNADATPKGNAKTDEVLFQAYEYGFVSDELIQLYYKIVGDKELTREQKIKRINEEINTKILPVYSLITLNTPLIDKDLKEITGFPINEVIRKTDKFTQVLAIAKFSPEGLSERAATVYKEMISQVMPIKETIECVDPISDPMNLLIGIKDFKFNTVDYNGNEVTSDIFKDYDVTLVNIWATWCYYCKKELPDLAQLYENFKDKKCNIIGITADVNLLSDEDAKNEEEVKKHEEALKTAKALTEKANCKYTLLQNSPSLQNLVSCAGSKGIPVTLFFDRNGNLIATSADDIIIGALGLEDFTKVLEEVLETVSKK